MKINKYFYHPYNQSLCITSAPTQLTNLLGLLGTRENFYTLIARLFAGKTLGHPLKLNCCYLTNMYALRPNKSLHREVV